MSDFDEFRFHPGVAAGVREAGYTTPTPIQSRAMPAVLEGRDVMGLAQTGTGKTAAFVLPILQRLAGGKRGTLRALIVAPTRELAEQIHEAVRLLGRRIGIRSATAYGGVNIRPQIRQLKRGVDVLVACPGRLLDHVGRKTVNLSKIEILVLDEADHMFDMGFVPDIRRIVRELPNRRQTLMFSATMPREISHLAREALTDPVTVKVDRTAPPATVRHALYPVASDRKTPLLMKLLGQTDAGSVLIFTRTKHRAKRLGEKLARAGHNATSLQGNLSQSQRRTAMDGFRSGRYKILVATDIAARGIDVTRVSHVINFDIPDTPEAYIHRIGRTGRAARDGDAFTFVTRDDMVMVRNIERLLGNALERRHMEGFEVETAVPHRAAKPARPPRRPNDRKPTNRSGKGTNRSGKPGNRYGKKRSQGRKKVASGRRSY
ncbi:MAG: DEAD/DEAH box helicase [Planctomycetota bacterium]